MFLVMCVCLSTRECCTGPWPPDIFKLVHYEEWTVDKQAVGIQLKCLLVESIFPLLPLDMYLLSLTSLNTYPEVVMKHNFNYYIWKYIYCHTWGILVTMLLLDSVTIHCINVIWGKFCFIET